MITVYYMLLVSQRKGCSWYSTGQRKVKRIPRNLRVYYAGTRLFYAECGDSLRV